MSDPLPTTPSPSTSTTSDADAPLTDEELLALLPEDAQYADIRGAMAVAVWFMEYRDDIYKGADLRPWEQLSSDECGYCAGELSESASYRDGAVIEGGDNIVDSDSIDGYLGDDGRWYVFFDLEFGAFEVDLPDGTMESGPAEFYEVTVALDIAGTRWSVVGVMFGDNT